MTRSQELQMRLETLNEKIAELHTQEKARKIALQKLEHTRVNSRSMFRREMLETIIKG